MIRIPGTHMAEGEKQIVLQPQHMCTPPTLKFIQIFLIYIFKFQFSNSKVSSLSE